MLRHTASQPNRPRGNGMPTRQILREVSDGWQVCVAEGDITGRSKCCRPVCRTLLLPAALHAYLGAFRSPQTWTAGSEVGPDLVFPRLPGDSNVWSGRESPSDIDSASHSVGTGCILPHPDLGSLMTLQIPEADGGWGRMGEIWGYVCGLKNAQLK